ncbi:MAG: DUF4367 domain-containing protein [Clostridia bacterium]|nr:DUF4367 domain-containing protein [Clostridia bacterium]
MTEYNKRSLKNVLEDIREENDKLFLKEIEKADSNPLFANTNETDTKMLAALEQSLKCSKKKKRRKKLLRAASILVALLVGISAITLTVDGVREKLCNLIAKTNPSYSVIVSADNKNSQMLAEYKGIYIPTYIPQEYEIKNIQNQNHNHSILLENGDGKIISYAEHLKTGMSFHFDTEDLDSYEETAIAGFDAIITKKGDRTMVIIMADEAVISVIGNDPELDLVGFAKHIEKR